MIRLFFLPTLIVLLFQGFAFAQNGSEVMVDLEYKSIGNQPRAKQAIKGVIELPFFDDFSRRLHYPTPLLWEGNSVFVNTTYAINPKTIGVATFDALDGNGNLHYQASSFPFSADTLSSRPINLNYPNDTTIYISFYFQPQGLGNQPDLRDSLLLEFYDSTNDQWVGAWAAWADFSNKKLNQRNKLLNKHKENLSDTLHKTFFQVHFPIQDNRFITSEFRFRFRNIASLSANTDVPGLRGNSDHWHIDLVYLNRNRSYIDTIINDIAFYKPLTSILKNYESIPWHHFNDLARTQELTSQLNFTINYRNLGHQTWNITRRFSILNHSNLETYLFSGGAENIFAFENVKYDRPYLYGIESAWLDSAKFTYNSFLVTDINPETYHLRWNDTLQYTQTYKNYYAYDDGTAESGYGLYGEGTQNGRVALKFNNYKADWLVGAYFFFNRTFNDANQKYFKLAIWNDDNGKPGSIIYEQEGLRPIFTNELNKFTLFKLDEEIWLDPGTFYVGWIQTTTDMLNVGFDRNRLNRTKLFYNIEGNWVNSQFDGSLMIRPVFGKLYDSPTAIEKIADKPAVTIFPNPANQFISLRLSQPIDDLSFCIYNIAGQHIYSKKYDNQPVDISKLVRGTYIVRFYNKKGVIGTQKLIVF